MFFLPGIMVFSFPCPMESVDFCLLLWFVCNKIEAISFLIVTTSSDGCSYFVNQIEQPFLPSSSYSYDDTFEFSTLNWYG